MPGKTQTYAFQLVILDAAKAAGGRAGPGTIWTAYERLDQVNAAMRNRKDFGLIELVGTSYTGQVAGWCVPAFSLTDNDPETGDPVMIEVRRYAIDLARLNPEDLATLESDVPLRLNLDESYTQRTGERSTLVYPVAELYFDHEQGEHGSIPGLNGG